MTKQVATNISDDHLIPKNETGYVHAIIQKEEYDIKTGKARFKPRIIIMLPADWNTFLKNPLGFEVKEILHRPKGSKAKVPDDLRASVAKAEAVRLKEEKKQEANLRDMRGGDKDAHQKKSEAEGVGIDRQELDDSKERMDAHKKSDSKVLLEAKKSDKKK